MKVERIIDMNDYLELSTIENMKQYLEDEREALKTQYNMLKSEINKLDDDLAEARAYIASYDNREKEHAANSEKLKTKKDHLIEQINNAQQNIKTVRQDIDRSSALKDALQSELADVFDQKALTKARYADIEEGIKAATLDRKEKMPDLKNYNDTLRNAHRLFKEAESRMDISIKLRPRKLY
jgi:chromosome segregation ATPase